MDDTHIGKISKEWGGLMREWFTDADNFGIEFPNCVDVPTKTLLLGACILIVIYFRIIYCLATF